MKYAIPIIYNDHINGDTQISPMEFNPFIIVPILISHLLNISHFISYLVMDLKIGVFKINFHSILLIQILESKKTRDCIYFI